MKILSIQIIRIIRKKSLIRIVRIFGQWINSNARAHSAKQHSSLLAATDPHISWFAECALYNPFGLFAFACCAGVRSTQSQWRNCIFLQRRNYCATLRQSERAWQCALGQPVIAYIGGFDHCLWCQRALALTPF